MRRSYLTILFLPSFAFATIINVPADYATIQAAIGAATAGDTVLVQPGTYVENINFNGKNVVVGSLYLTTGDTATISQTVIDGDQIGFVVVFNSLEDTTAVLSGFTITNGLAFNGGGINCFSSSPSLKGLAVSGNTAITNGGGIYCAVNSSPILENVTVTGNTASESGGGIYCADSSNASLVNVTVSGNTAASDGGGIYCESSSPRLDNVTVSGNSAEYGGGIFCDNSSNPSLVNVTVSENTATSYYGGGIYLARSSPSLESVTVSRNTSSSHGGGIYCADNSSPSLVNVTVSGNSAFASGGGIYCTGSSSPSLDNVAVRENTSSSHGGGIYCADNSSPRLVDVTVTGNTSSSYGSHGGGIYLRGSNPSLESVTVSGNTASQGWGGGIYCYRSSPMLANVTVSGNLAGGPGGGIYCQNSTIDIVNSILWNDQPSEIDLASSSVTMNYSLIQYGWDGVGNIFTEPQFINPDSGDFYLRSSSPGIDAGDPTSPLDPDSTRADMGAFYFDISSPVLEALADATVLEDDTLQIALFASDPDGDPLAFSAISDTSALETMVTDSLLGLVPAEDWNGTVEISVIVSDGEFRDGGDFTITVTPVNDPPEPFTLLAPADGDTAVIINDSLVFIWESVTDVDSDSLVYIFHLLGPDLDTSVAGLTDASVTFTGVDGLTIDSLYTWFVEVTDGEYTTASTATFGFYVPHVLALYPLAGLPVGYALHQNHPNPFNPTTTIRFELPQAGPVALVVYDLRGREVARLAEGQREAGYHQVTWAGRDAAGREVPTGIYIARLTTPGYAKSIKMLLLK